MDLGKMIGPLPLGAWIAAVAGSLGLAVVLNREGSDDPQATTAPTPTPPESIFIVDRSGGNLDGEGGGGGAAGTSAFESNNEWRLYVATNIVGRGIADAAAIDGALNRYLRGDPEQPGDAAIVSAALQVAFPPDPAPARYVVDEPEPYVPTPNTPTPPAQHQAPPTTAPATTTAQTIRDIFTRYGVSLGTTHTASSETEAERVARIAREVDSGTRSLSNVTKSVQLLAQPAAPAQLTTEQQIRNLFASAGVPTGYHSGTSSESEAQRIARITAEVQSGTRTLAQVQKSVNLLAASR